MSPWLALRLAKFVALGLFAAGLWEAAVAPTQARRQRAAQVLTPLGLQVLWLAGYGMMTFTGRGFEPFILIGIAGSIVASSGALLGAETPRRALGAALSAGGFTCALGAMVSRGSADALLAGFIPIVVALLAGAWAMRTQPPEPSPGAPARTLRWFVWVARLEGASLLLMVGVSMPLRTLAGVSLDGGTGTIGWVHGALTLLYFQALFAAARAAGWGLGTMLAAFAAAMLPGGTFVFERRVLR